jgi:hypothetical protein
MKRIILSSLLLGGVLMAGAQNLSMGPIIGVNHSWLTNSGDNKSFNPGLNIGGTMTYSFNPNWGIGGDLLLSMEGARFRNEGSLSTTTRDVALNFIRLQPKFYHFFGQLGDAVRPKLFIGGSLGALVGGKQKVTIAADNESADVVTKTPSKDSYNNIDAGILAGAGINWKLGKASWLTTDLVYNNGLVDLSKSNNNWQASRSLSFNLGLTFPIGTVNPQ